MALFTGVIARDGALIQEDVPAAMAAALPASELPTFFVEPGLALAALAQHLTPQDRDDSQPMRDRSGRLCLVADARLDRRDELCSALGLDSETTRTAPDAALILRAFETWGENCVAHLRGDFAFAIWDRANRHLFAARDPLGQAPMSYHVGPHYFGFASSAGALRYLPDVVWDLDSRQLAAAFANLYNDPGRSFFRNIFHLRPGHAMWWRQDRVHFYRFWDPVPVVATRPWDPEESLERFIAVFERAVTDRTRLAKPYGTMLSGGLDSTSIAAILADHNAPQGGRIDAFTYVPRPDFPAPALPRHIFNERSLVEAMGRRYPALKLHFVDTQGATIFDQLEPFFAAAGAPPTGIFNVLWFQRIVALAQAKGLGALFSGEGGNLTISWHGHPRVRELFLNGSWSELARQVNGLAKSLHISRRHICRSLLLKWFVPNVFLDAVLHRSFPRPYWERLSFLRPSWWQDVDFRAEMKHAGRDAYRFPGWDHQHFRGQTYRIGQVVSGAPFRVAFRFMNGILSLFPGNDSDIIELCLSFPQQAFLDDGRDRVLIRRAMQHRLPAEILENHRRGRQSGDWHLGFGEILPILRADLAAIEADSEVANYVDIRALKTALGAWPPSHPLMEQVRYQWILHTFVVARFIRWFRTQKSDQPAASTLRAVNTTAP